MRLAPSFEANPKGSRGLRCVSFWCPRTPFTASCKTSLPDCHPEQSDLKRDSCSPSHTFCHKGRVLCAALNLKMSQCKHLQKVSCGRLERAEEVS